MPDLAEPTSAERIQAFLDASSASEEGEYYQPPASTLCPEWLEWRALHSYGGGLDLEEEKFEIGGGSTYSFVGIGRYSGRHFN